MFTRLLARLSSTMVVEMQSDCQKTSALSITGLPVEIFIRILLEAAFTWNDDATESQDPNCPYAWIVVTHVCHYWRTVALDTPSLWTRIFASVAGSDCLRAFLERSKQLPLDVFAFAVYTQAINNNSKVSSALRTLLPECYRFRSFEIYGEEACDTFLGFSYPDGAPLLETLSVSDHNFGLPYVGPPVTFLDHGLPSLTKLELTNWRVGSLAEISCPRLRSLSVYDPGNPFTVSDWTAFLSTTPLLETMDTRDAIFADTALPAPSVPTSISLPHLRSICVEIRWNDSDGAPDAALLRKLDIPPNCSITLNMRSLACADNMLTAVEAKLSEPHYADHPARTLSILRRSTVCVEAWNTPMPAPTLCSHHFRSTNCADRSPSLSLNLDFGWSTEPADVERAYHRVREVLGKIYDLSYVQTLAFEDGELPRSSDWSLWDASKEILQSMTNLKTLLLSGTRVETNIEDILGRADSVSPTIPDSTGSSEAVHDDHPLFPHLQALSVFDLNLEPEISVEDLTSSLQTEETRGGRAIDQFHVCSVEQADENNFWDRMELPCHGTTLTPRDSD